MSTLAIKTIVKKEWAELYQNTLVLTTVILMPLFFAVLPLVIIWATGSFDTGTAVDAANTGLPPEMMDICQGLSRGQCGQIFIASQFTLLFMMIPLIIPATISPYAIVGEKTQRSLEPLLATPITTTELVLAKNLAAIIPAVLATWATYVLYAIGAWLLIQDPVAFSRLFGPRWLLAVFLLGPLLAILSVNLAIMVSSRSSDPRVAQQIASLIVLPIVFLFIGQVSGFVVLNETLVILTAIVTFFLDAFLTFMAVRIFDRETILTRWT